MAQTLHENEINALAPGKSSSNSTRTSASACALDKRGMHRGNLKNKEG